MKVLACLLTLLSLAAVGCSDTQAPAMMDELQKVKAADAPGPWRLAIAPVEVRLTAALGPSQTADAEEYWWPVEVKPGEIRSWATLAATESKAFADVSFVESLAYHERMPTSAEVAAKEGGRGGAGGAGTPATGAAVAKPPPGAGRPAPLPVPATLTARLAFPVATPPAEGFVIGTYFERGDDLLLSLRVVRHSVHYVERSGAYVPNLLFLYFVWIFPAWLVADEVYETRVEVEAELRAISADRPIWTKLYSARKALALDSFDRGWMFTGQVTVPGWLEAENYREAGKHLLPHAMNEIAAALKKDLAAAPLTRAEQIEGRLRPRERFSISNSNTDPDDRGGPVGATATAGGEPMGATATAERTISPGAVLAPPPCREEIEEGLPATFLLCFGVSKIERSSQPPPPRYASEEAEALSRVGLDRTRGALPARNVSVLVDTRGRGGARGCIRDTIVFDLKRYAARASERDTLIVYFSGLGFATEDDLHLVPFDFRPARPLEVTVSLADLERILAKCRARQAVILDASFDGAAPAGEDARTVPRALLGKMPGAVAAEDGGARVKARLEAFAAKHPRRVVVTSGAPGEAVPEISPVQDQKGLFTARLLSALGAPAVDANRDGAIDLGEAAALARRETIRLSSSAGAPQTPTLYPSADAETRAREVVLARPRAAASAGTGAGSPR